MYSLTDPWYWANFLYFWVAVLFAYYIPAKVLLGRLKLGFSESLGICIPIGIALWAWQGYVFGYLHIRWATYVYLGLFFLLWMSQPRAGNYLRRIRQTLSSIAIDRVSLWLILVGVFMQLTAVWFTGVKVAGQQYFCCGNIYDSFWFAGVTQELTNRFPPLIPGMEGEKLTGYHFWSNLAVADLVRVFRLPLFPTAFAWSGLLISLTLGLALLAFVQIIKFPTAFGRWLLFFFYLGGDAVWLLLLVLRNTNLFSMSSLEDGVKFLSNLPRAYAVVVFLAALNLFLLWLGKRGRRIGFLTVLALASLAGFKIYVGLFAYLGLGILALYYLWKKDTRPLFLTALTALLTLIIYLSANAGSGGLYYTGFWRFENFAVQPALGLIRLEMARQIFWEHGNWIRVLGYDYFFLALYVIAIFGTKLAGLLQTRKSLALYSLDLHLLFLPGVAVSFIAGNFFQQTVGSSNTFNFLVSVFTFGSFYTALAAWWWTRKLPRRVVVGLAILLITLTIPRVAYEAGRNVQNIRRLEGVVLEKEKEEAYDFIEAHTPKDASFLVDNFRGHWYDTEAPTVSVLTQRHTYYSGRGILTNLRQDTFEREKTSKTILLSPNPEAIAKTLKDSPIDYLLVASSEAILATDAAKFLNPVFNNSQAVIYEVDRDKIAQYLHTAIPQ